MIVREEQNQTTAKLKVRDLLEPQTWQGIYIVNLYNKARQTIPANFVQKNFYPKMGYQFHISHSLEHHLGKVRFLVYHPSPTAVHL